MILLVVIVVAVTVLVESVVSGLQFWYFVFGVVIILMIVGVAGAFCGALGRCYNSWHLGSSS